MTAHPVSGALATAAAPNFVLDRGGKVWGAERKDKIFNLTAKDGLVCVMGVGVNPRDEVRRVAMTVPGVDSLQLDDPGSHIRI